MDVTRESRGHLARLAAWFEATPAELVGLLVLVVGALLASLLLWLDADRRPDVLPTPAAGVGAAVGPSPDGWQAPPDHPAGGGDGSHAHGSREDEVTVHVTGAVDAPGLVTLPSGARVGDAVAAAGGLAHDADPERLNLARRLGDGEHVHVPRQGEDLPPATGSDAAGGGTTADGRIDLNRASEGELETLPGIGPTRAAAIVAHREEHGPFGAPGDLREVPGIGEATFQRLAELVVVR